MARIHTVINQDIRRLHIATQKIFIHFCLGKQDNRSGKRVHLSKRLRSFSGSDHHGYPRWCERTIFCYFRSIERLNIFLVNRKQYWVWISMSIQRENFKWQTHSWSQSGFQCCQARMKYWIPEFAAWVATRDKTQEHVRKRMGTWLPSIKLRTMEEMSYIKWQKNAVYQSTKAIHRLRFLDLQLGSMFTKFKVWFCNAYGCRVRTWR